MLTRMNAVTKPLFWLALFGTVLVPPAFAGPGQCNINTPGQTLDPPTQLRETWQPIRTLSDATVYNGTQPVSALPPLVTSVDVANGYLFASNWNGFEVYDISGPNAANPQRVGNRIDYWAGHFGEGDPGSGAEFDQHVYWIDAPEGDDQVASLGAYILGLSIWDTSNKLAMQNKYWVENLNVGQVHMARIGAKRYTFAAIFSGTAAHPYGVGVYDASAALLCANRLSCSGVRVGTLSSGFTPKYVNGTQFGTKYLLAVGSNESTHSAALWDVSDPTAPRQIGGLSPTAYARVGGVATWVAGSQALMAVRTDNAVKIFDVTSCAAVGAGCGVNSLGTLVGEHPIAPLPSSSYYAPLVYSTSGTTRILHAGNSNICYPASPGGHTEVYLDVTNPSTPVDISPTAAMIDNQETVDYLSWYYPTLQRGFSNYSPMNAKFSGEYVYRAGHTLFDVHRWTGGANNPPVASFTYSPQPAYAGQQMTFSDTSSGTVLNRAWLFSPDGSPGSGSTSSVNVTFPTAATKSVQLQVGNLAGSDTETQSIPVLEPAPAIQSVTPSPSPAFVCQPVSWAVAATGRPALSYTWSIRDGGNAEVATGSGNPFVWQTASAPPGVYTGQVTVSNAFGSPATASAPLTLQAAPALGFGVPPISVGTITFGNVTFTANTTGATEWVWDFGDGTAPQTTTTPSVSHSYETVGAYSVTVTIRNCATTNGIASSPVPVVIDTVVPLAARFDAVCPFGLCAFQVGVAIEFLDSSTGAQFWDYDWDGNPATGVDGFEEAGRTAPQTQHAYAVAGTYSPRLRVRRGTETNVFLHRALGVATASPPSIQVNGPASGNVNTAYTFTATAFNCTANASGWSWSTGGGSGSSSTGTISITWSSAGQKTVTASNSACAGAFGAQSVAIAAVQTSPFTANFNYLPASPTAGGTVTFDASSSTGSPTAFAWEFGDGSTASTGPVVTHVYSSSGSFPVTLTISKLSDDCNLRLCTSKLTKTLTLLSSVTASFSTSANCLSGFGPSGCSAEAGQEISFSYTGQGATSLSWDFGDGGSAVGSQATHVFATAGAFVVKLSATNGTETVTATKTFQITAPPPPPAPTKVAIAWIAQTQKPVVQTSDLFVNNPSDAPMTVDIFFRKRGVPEANPPKQTRVVPARGTIYVGDVLAALFARPDQSGFIVVEVKDGTGLPIVNSFNTTLDVNGNQFGQALPGVPFRENSTEASTARTWHVVGLNDDQERDAYLGLTNPGPAPAILKLRFFSRLGGLLSQNEGVSVPGFGQKQFSLFELRTTYHVQGETDWRVEIEPAASTPLMVYGTNRRLATKDPSSLGGADGSQQRVYLLGAIDGIGLQNALWQSDLVMANPTDTPQRARVTFSEAGLQATTSAPVFFDLAGRETRRVTDVITATFGRTNKAGLLTIESQSSAAPYLVAQGESYNNADPAKRFGQTLPPIYEAEAATAGHSMNLVGLRQDADYRVTMWIANVDPVEVATMSVVYRDLAGNVVKRIDAFSLPPGRLKQYPKSAHPSVAGGRFTVGIEVLSGKVIAGAQVVNNKSNDPAYVKGQAN